MAKETGNDLIKLLGIALVPQIAQCLITKRSWAQSVGIDDGTVSVDEESVYGPAVGAFVAMESASLVASIFTGEPGFLMLYFMYRGINYTIHEKEYVSV